MTTLPPEPPKPAASSSRDKQVDAEDAVRTLEQQMAELGLSSGDKRFLRNLRLVEKQLNDAIEETRQCEDLEQRVSEVYRRMYGTD